MNLLSNLPKTLCSLSYIIVDDAIENLLELDPTPYWQKQILRVLSGSCSSNDRNLLAIQWGNSIYIDGCLLFGLCSTLKLFNIMAELLSWIRLQKGISQILHYLDDFLVRPSFSLRMPTESHYIHTNMHQPGCSIIVTLTCLSTHRKYACNL